MKRLLMGILVLTLAAHLSAQTTIALPDVQQPHQIAVEGNDLYVFDEADYSLHIYTISPFAPKLKFGRKGDGPHDFKYLPYVYIQPETLGCTDFIKILWFSKKGEVLKAMEFSELKDFDPNSEMLLVPVKEHYVRILADHAQHKRSIFLLDSGFKTVKKLYEGPFIWEAGDYIEARTDTLSYRGLIFIANTLKGFHFTIFDDKGKIFRTIDKSKEVGEIPGHLQLHQYCVSDDKIYATTYRKKDGQTEMIVLDLQGRILRTLYLPLSSIRPNRGILRYDPFTVSGEKLYELIQSGGMGTWELRITDLASAR